LRASRRRQRTTDPLAHPDAVRAVLALLRERLPEIIPTGEKQIIRLLNAVRNIERRPATDTNRGRPSRWGRKDLHHVASQLRLILSRETRGRVSLNSFVGLYIRVLDFPKDVTSHLIAGDITLFEAAQLARLTGKRLAVSGAEARQRRSEILRAHILAQGSQASLQARVNEQLGSKDGSISPASPTRATGIELVDDLLELDPYDTRHLFWEELRRIAFVLREISPDDIDRKTLDEFLSASDRLSSILDRIQKRSRRRKPTNFQNAMDRHG
jgi:hypothetical protein